MYLPGTLGYAEYGEDASNFLGRCGLRGAFDALVFLLLNHDTLDARSQFIGGAPTLASCLSILSLPFCVMTPARLGFEHVSL
jgi:hypothetical protein